MPAVERALITGASGFVGSALTRRLQAEGTRVVGLARRVPSSRPEVLQGDVCNPDEMTAAFHRVKPTHVFHLAASRLRGGSMGDLSAALAVNALGTVNVVSSAAAVGCERVVVLGTAEEYGTIDAPFSEDDRECPASPYGISKLAGTRAALAAGTLSGTPVTVVRATVAYGYGQPEDMFLAQLLSALLEGRTFPMSQGLQTRDFLFVDDLVEGLVRAASATYSAPLLVNIGSGETITIREVARLAERVAGAVGLVRLGAIEVRPTEATSYAVDLSRAGQVLRWGGVTSLEQGLVQTVDAMKS